MSIIILYKDTSKMQIVKSIHFLSDFFIALSLKPKTKGWISQDSLQVSFCEW